MHVRVATPGVAIAPACDARPGFASVAGVPCCADNHHDARTIPAENARMSQPAAAFVVLAMLSGSPAVSARAEASPPAVTPVSPVDAARAAFRARRWDEAGTLAGAALAADPASLEARRIRGFSRGRLKDYAGSLADFHAALAADPDDAEAWHGAAKTLRLMGDLSSALAVNARALRLSPDTPDYLVENGVILFLSRDFGASSAAFERVNGLRPSYPGINAYRAELFLYLKNGDMARAAAEEGLRLEPDYGIHRINLAHAALFSGDPEKAKALYLASADLIDMDGVTPGRALVPLDFAKMRAAGVIVPGMEEIEALLKK